MFESKFLLIACLALTTISTYEASPTESLHSQWTQFKAQYGKQYASAAEEAKRLELFAENKLKVDKFNLEQSAEAGYTLAVNHLSDRTDEEFRQLLGFTTPSDHPIMATGESSSGSGTDEDPLPDSVDWRQHGRVSSVKDQGNCGSSYAFAAVGVLEGQLLPVKNISEPISLSVQNVIDCGTYSYAPCFGGDMSTALIDIAAQGGLQSEKDYPYLASPSECKFNKSLSVIRNKGFLSLKQDDELALKEWVANSGPISVGIEVSKDGNFRHYKSGVYTDKHCHNDRSFVNLAALVVGYGTDSNHNDYWIIKNAWSAAWGDEGYIKLARNKENMCGIATFGAAALF